MEIKETTVEPKKYLVWRKEIEIKNVMDPAMWQTAYGKVHEYIQKNNLTVTGPGVALYFRWNNPEGKGEIGIGNPVADAQEVNDPDLSLVTVEASKAVMTTVHGAYNEFPKHHSKLANYLKEQNREESLTLEEYIVTGMQNPDPQAWETNLYHLYK